MNLDEIVDGFDREKTMILELETLNTTSAAVVLWHADEDAMMVTFGVADGKPYAEVTAWRNGIRADVVTSDAFGSALVQASQS